MIITRKVGNKIQTYEYKQKDNANNTKLNMRINEDTLCKIKCLSEYLGLKNYSQYIRDVIEKDLDRYVFVEKTIMSDRNKNYIVKEKE